MVAAALEIAGRGTDAIYVTVDIDVLEVGYAPGTAAATADGLSPIDLLEALFVLGRDPRVMAIDFVELDPDPRRGRDHDPDLRVGDPDLPGRLLPAPARRLARLRPGADHRLGLMSYDHATTSSWSEQPLPRRHPGRVDRGGLRPAEVAVMPRLVCVAGHVTGAARV